jgi:hypothetical protein
MVISCVNRLLKDIRVDPSANNNEAIRWASQNDHIACVNILLEDSRVYNDSWVKRTFKNELKVIEEVQMYRKKIIDSLYVPEDLIYEISKYLHHDTNYYKIYLS